MAVTTKKQFPNAVGTNGQSATVFTPVGIQLNNQDDLDVYVTLSGGTRVLQLRQSTGSTAQSSHPQVNNTDGLYFPAVSAGTTLYNYQLSTDNNTITFSTALPTGATVFVERRTRDADSSYTTFASGSTIRATDLNNSSTESNFTAQDGRNKALTIEGVLFRGDQPSTNFVTTDHIVDGTIVESDIANSAITSNKIADNAVTTTEILNGAVTRAKLEADAVDGTKLADNAVNSEHYTDGSIGTIHLGAGIINSAKLADNAVNSQHYVDGSIDREHLAADIVDGTKIADDSIDSEHIAAGALDNEHYAAGSITSDKLNGATVVTNSEQAASTPNDTSFFTTAAAEARYFNASTGETIKDGQTFPDNDTTIATTAAINDRIIDLVDDVGGFVPIANETSFPTSNPDVNDGAGTIVSVSAASTDLVPSGTTVTIANGRGSGLAVIITGVNATIPSGFGFLVETTTTDHTYSFHRLSPKATEVTTVASKATEVTTVHTNINNVNTVATNISDINAVAADASDIGAVAAKATEIGRLGTADAVADMAILGTADVVSDLNTLGTADVVADMNMLATSDVVADMALLATTDVISDMNDLATSANITAMSNCSGSIANINTTASNLTNINNFANVYRIGANNPTTSLDTGDLFFNTTSNSLKVYTGSAWVDGVTQTGNFALKTGNTFTGSNIYNDNVKAQFGTGSDLEIYHDGTHSRINDNGTGDLRIKSDNLQLQNPTGEEYFVGNSNGSVELYFDDSKKLETTSTGATVTGILRADEIRMGDSGGATSPNERIRLGNSEDLELYHDGTHSYIDNHEGELYIRGDGDDIFLKAVDTKDSLRCLPNDAVYLFFNDSKKLETTSTGINVTGVTVDDGATHDGDVTFKGNVSTTDLVWDKSHDNLRFNDNVYARFGTGSDLQIFHNGQNSFIDNNTGDFYIQTTGSGDDIFIEAADDFQVSTGGETAILAVGDGEVQLYHNNSKKFETTSSGVTVTGSITPTGNVTFADSSAGGNNRVTFGSAGDLQIWHDGSNSYIADEGTGDLLVSGDSVSIVNAAATEFKAKFISNGAVELYYDNAKKFETTSGGVNIPSGNLKIPDSGGTGYGRLVVGSGDDIQLYHNGTDSFIDNANGNLAIRTTSATHISLKTNNENAIYCGANGAVQLYYDNVKKFETISSGTSITGSLGINTTSPAVLIDARTTSGGSIQVQNTSSNIGVIGINVGSAENFIYSKGDGATAKRDLTFMLGTSKAARFDTNLHFRPESDSTHDLGTNAIRWRNLYADTLYGDGSNLTGINTDLVSDTSPQLGGDLDTNSHHILLDDNHQVKFGDGNDFNLQHNGTDSYIINTTGILYRRSANHYFMNQDGSEYMFIAQGNGAFKAYYDGANKFQSESTGLAINAGGHLRIANGAWTGNHAGKIQFHDNYLWFQGGTNGFVFRSPSGTNRVVISGDGHFEPQANNTYDMGTSSNRWRNVFTNDLNLSNKGSANDVDGTWGDWTIQEGESDLFLKNNRSGKKYKFNLTEVS